MGELHDRAVEDIYKTLDNVLDSSAYEVVQPEQDYFEGQVDPLEVPDRRDRGKQVGEFDIIAVNYDERVMHYVEVKPYSTGTSYAREQIERAESFWEPRGWDVYGSTHVVDRWQDNWYDQSRDMSIDSLLEEIE